MTKSTLMTGNKCLLDTSVIIHSFKRHSIISAKLDEMAEVYVPVIVIGELFYGAYKSADPVKHFTQMQTFLSNCKTLMPDSTSADLYGKIKFYLAKKGRPIPENDIWIAAIAQQYNLPLFTTDQHFLEIEHIILIK